MDTDCLTIEDQQFKIALQETETLDTLTTKTCKQRTKNQFKNVQKLNMVCSQCGIYSCNSCESKSSVLSNRKGRNPVANDSMKYQCTQCSLKYVNKKDMVKHKKFVHDGIHTTYTCNICEFQCLRKHLLVRHKDVIHEGLRHICDKCDYKTTNKYSLKEHKRSIHEGAKYTCSMCEFTSSYKKSVRKHYQRIHKGVLVESIRSKGYDCELCGFSATGQKQLLQHNRFEHE